MWYESRVAKSDENTRSPSDLIDARIAELIDSKAGLAARALDGSDEEVTVSADVQLEALVGLLSDALEERG